MVGDGVLDSEIHGGIISMIDAVLLCIAWAVFGYALAMIEHERSASTSNPRSPAGLRLDCFRGIGPTSRRWRRVLNRRASTQNHIAIPARHVLVGMRLARISATTGY